MFILKLSNCDGDVSLSVMDPFSSCFNCAKRHNRDVAMHRNNHQQQRKAGKFCNNMKISQWMPFNELFALQIRWEYVLGVSCRWVLFHVDDKWRLACSVKAGQQSRRPAGQQLFIIAVIQQWNRKNSLCLWSHMWVLPLFCMFCFCQQKKLCIQLSAGVGLLALLTGENRQVRRNRRLRAWTRKLCNEC